MRRLLALALALAAACPAAAQTAAEADGSRTMAVEAWVPAAPADVWQAVTTAEGWKRWAVAAAWYVAPDLLETSYDPDARPGGANNIQQRIVAALPGRILVFRNARTPAGFPHAEAFARVTQFLELAPDGDGTRVRLTGAGYPAGAEGDALLAFFEPGNRMTLDALVARFARAPLDFLVGHCWRGTLPSGDANIHCFDLADGKVRDRHQVLRAGKKVYGGETLYAWDPATRTLGFAYTGEGSPTAHGTVRRDGPGLDFGATDYGGVTIATRWVRIGDDAYEARDTSADPRFSHDVKYVRAD